jgi:FkbM family methyltransferase
MKYKKGRPVGENMRHFFMRIQSFVNRLCWLGRYMPGYLQAAIYMVRIKFSPSLMGKADYKGYEFSFQPRDMSAIREVLADSEYTFLSPLLKSHPSPVILDVGAHIGLFSLWALGDNPASRILSVEASPDTFPKTRVNCDKARAQGRQWEVFHAAAWSKSGSVSFKTSGESMGHHVSVEGGNILIPTLTLADMIEKAQKVYHAHSIEIMKVDIEGAEEEFIVAGEKMLPHIQNLIIELHPEKCNVDNVRIALGAHYNRIVECGSRASRKPLLHCYRQSP